MPCRAGLVDLTSEAVAKTLVDSEKSRRKSEIQLQQTREKTLAKNIENLKKSIDIRRGRVGYIENSVDARTNRLSSLRGLQDRGSVTNYVVVQAQSDWPTPRTAARICSFRSAMRKHHSTKRNSSRRNSERMLARNSMEN